jgi:hypothetical protein
MQHRDFPRVAWVSITVPRAEAEATARIVRAEDASRAAGEAVRLGTGASLIAGPQLSGQSPVAGA